MSERLSHSAAGWSTTGRVDTFRVFITSSCFRFISLNCTFLEKSLYCDFLLLLRSPRSPTIAFSSGTLLPSPSSSSSLQCRARPRSLTAPSFPQSAAFPPHLSLSPLSSYTRLQPLTHSARRPPPPPPLPSPPLIHLLPAVFHAEEDSCLNVYVKSYFLFSLGPDQFPKWTLWHVLKYSRWWAKSKSLTSLLYSDPGAKKRLTKGRLKTAHHCRGNAE